MNIVKRFCLIILTVVLTLFPGCTEFNTDMAEISAPSKPVDGGLVVSFIDVGQGDSTFINLPSGKTMLIDAGEWDAAENVKKFIKNQGVEKIDVVICTHPHSDHIGGMKDVIEEFEIGDIYMPKVEHPTSTYTKLLTCIKDMGKKIKSAKSGVTIDIDPDVEIKIISPINSEYEDINNYSAVVRLIYNKSAFLFTGDAEKEVENELLGSGENLHSSVLKVGHHGSPTSSTKNFLKAVSPQIAVISVGKDNEYNHPNKTVLSRLGEVGAQIYRTDEDGTVQIASDGEKIWIVE